MKFNRREVLKLGLAAVANAYIIGPTAIVVQATKKACSVVIAKLSPRQRAANTIATWWSEQIDKDINDIIKLRAGD